MTSDDDFRDAAFLRILPDTIKMHMQAKPGVATAGGQQMNIGIDFDKAFAMSWQIAQAAVETRAQVRAQILKGS